jgi:hypothetical protein
VSSNTWSAAASLPVASAGSSPIALRDGRYAVLGGGTQSLNSPTPTGQAVAYNQTKARWEALPSLVTPRISAMAYELQACGLWVVGGGVGLAGKATTSFEMLVR